MGQFGQLYAVGVRLQVNEIDGGSGIRLPRCFSFVRPSRSRKNEREREVKSGRQRGFPHPGLRSARPSRATPSAEPPGGVVALSAARRPSSSEPKPQFFLLFATQIVIRFACGLKYFLGLLENSSISYQIGIRALFLEPSAAEIQKFQQGNFCRKRNSRQPWERRWPEGKLKLWREKSVS
ncbi:hypothetical protein MA16_Dca009359 [Dendrobium catenatum]|uniref:Uncharacterized protein n=1 Tax=Dendrobium catenatum TaxID=906689 RepID=A0A2I0XH18_9ASPA|nr:hypothetical protein MA16_Dca009359 [Dendrobium catenatum]